MILYDRLSKIGFLKNSYTLKFLFVAFLGIHVPLIGMIFFLVFFNAVHSATTILVVVLLLTLIATVLTLFLLKKLVAPIKATALALDNYKINRIIPTLETESTDEVGKMITNIVETIKTNENLLKQKQDLIYLFTHDLKNFADNPVGLSQMILEEKPSATVSEYAHLIMESSLKQKSFLTTFITLMKEEEELLRRHVRVKSVDIQMLIAVVKEQLSQKLNNKKIELQINNTIDSIPLKVDKEFLSRVLVNLIENAIKFSYSGSCITVNFHREHSELTISIIDTGIGFDNSKSKILFKKFTAMGRIGTANEESTGIGLYLCSQIIKKSGGSITAESKGAEQGATFTISLKVYKRLS